MLIVRNYKKATKHKWWQITLEEEYIGSGSNKQLKHLNFVAYGFSSSKDYSKSKVDFINRYSNRILFVGTSKDHVLSKEKEMIQMMYIKIKKQLENNEEWLKEQKVHYEKKKLFFKSYFQIPEFKQISLNKKLQKINDRY
jgi:hypothetical protein